MRYKLCGSWYKQAKMSHIMSRSQKWAHFEKKYLPSDLKQLISLFVKEF